MRPPSISARADRSTRASASAGSSGPKRARSIAMPAGRGQRRAHQAGQIDAAKRARHRTSVLTAQEEELSGRRCPDPGRQREAASGAAGASAGAAAASDRADLPALGDENQQVVRREMRRRRKQHLFVLRALQGERAGRLSIACVVGEQLRRDARHDQRLAAQQRSGEGPHRKHLFPHHRSVVAIVPAQDVVERDEIHPLGVEHRQAEQIGAGAPAPIGVGVFSAERMKLIVARADEDAIADRQDAGGRLGKLVSPDFVAGLERERDNAAVFERKIHAVPGRRRAARSAAIRNPSARGFRRRWRESTRTGPCSVCANNQPASQCSEMTRPGTGRRHCGAAVGFRSRFDQVRRCRRRRIPRRRQAAQSSGIRPTTLCCRP